MPSALFNPHFQRLVYLPCQPLTGTRVWAAQGTVIAVTYNGIFLTRGLAAPARSYTATSQIISLNFDVPSGERGIDALCVFSPTV